jgi:hypothetical protein
LVTISHEATGGVVLIVVRHNRTIREYGEPQTPYARVLAAEEVREQVKIQLKTLHASLNPMALTRQIEKEKREIERCRILRA